MYYKLKYHTSELNQPINILRGHTLVGYTTAKRRRPTREPIAAEPYQLARIHSLYGFGKGKGVVLARGLDRAISIMGNKCACRPHTQGLPKEKELCSHEQEECLSA
jgi:hypothetical protein